jgi:hypothetical protein
MSDSIIGWLYSGEYPMTVKECTIKIDDYYSQNIEQ